MFRYDYQDRHNMVPFVMRLTATIKKCLRLNDGWASPVSKVERQYFDRLDSK